VAIERVSLWGETELTGGGMGIPSPSSFDLISLIRTPIQTELKPEPLALLARGFVKPVLLLTADVALRGTSSDEGISLLLSPRASAPRGPRPRPPRSHVMLT